VAYVSAPSARLRCCAATSSSTASRHHRAFIGIKIIDVIITSIHLV